MAAKDFGLIATELLAARKVDEALTLINEAHKARDAAREVRSNAFGLGLPYPPGGACWF